MRRLQTLTVFSAPIGIAMCAAWLAMTPPRSSASVEGVAATITPQPRIVTDGAIHRFGEMPVGRTARHTFTITNAGDAPLTLEQGKTSCKCTLSKIAREEIGPGERGTIDLEWQPDKPTDVFDKYATFRTNDPLHPSLTLSISGKVLPKIEYSPSTTWIVGELATGTTTETKGVVYSRSIDSFQVKSVQAADPRVRTGVRRLSDEFLGKLGARCGYELVVACDGAFEVGPFESTLTVVTNQEPERQILLRGERPAPVRLSGRNWDPGRRTLYFETFAAAKGARQVATFLVEGLPGVEAPRITEASSDEPSLNVHTTRLSQAGARRQAYRVDVTVSPNSPPIRRTDSNVAHVTLKTTHPAAPEFKFAVSLIAF